MTRKSFEERLQGCKNPLLRKLFQIVIDKKSNLCVAANFKSLDETIRFVDRIGKYIVVLKIQCARWPENPIHVYERLYAKKKEHNFLLFEDFKFNDSKETVQSIYSTLFVKYVDLVTVSPWCGDGIFEAIKEAAIKADLPDDEPRGCLAVCEVSFAQIPVDPKIFLEIAERNSNICVGIIAQKLNVSDQFVMIKATPGVHLDQSSDGGNQQWRHPDKVVADGADLLIVGRGIVAAPECEQEDLTRRYRDVIYEAFQS